MDTTQNKKDPLKKGQIYFCLLYTYEYEDEAGGKGDLCEVTQRNCSIQPYTVKRQRFFCPNKKFFKQINCRKNWPLSQIFCENAEKDS
jgi:hypothetical protein